MVQYLAIHVKLVFESVVRSGHLAVVGKTDDRSGYCVGTDAAILAYYLRILNMKCTLLIKLQPMFNIRLES